MCSLRHKPRMKRLLASTPVLISLAIAALCVGYTLQNAQDAAGGQLLDFVFTGQGAEALLNTMTAAQKTTHFWATVVNDTAYPIAYGGLLAGLTLRFGRGRNWLALPAIVTIVADLAENAVQALALSDTANILALKTVLTPLKFGLFAVAALIVIYLIAWAIGAKIADMREET